MDLVQSDKDSDEPRIETNVLIELGNRFVKPDEEGFEEGYGSPIVVGKGIKLYHGEKKADVIGPLFKLRKNVL